ncbi:MAG: hypothetical protein QXG00_00830 [Candidatus Woesearchaeota archaeon]
MRNETIVSIRLPKSLVKELKIISEKDHYKDLSELIRYVVRKRSLDYIKDYINYDYINYIKFDVRKIKENFFKKQKAKEEYQEKEKNKEKILSELKKIIEDLKNEL